MKNCNGIQQIIADLEFTQVIEDKAILQHIAACDECQAYQLACEEMHQALNQMTDFDADEGLVESTLSSILSLQEETQEVKEPQKPKRILSMKFNTQWASALAASFMLVSLIALFPHNSISNFGLISDNFSQIQSVTEEEKQAIKKRKEKLNRKKEANKADYEFIDVDIAEEVHAKYRRIPKKPVPQSLNVNKLMVGALGSESLSLSSPSKSGGRLQEQIKSGFKSAVSKDHKNLQLEPLESAVLEDPDAEMAPIPEGIVADSRGEFEIGEGSAATNKRTNEQVREGIKLRRKQMRDASLKEKEERQEQVLEKKQLTELVDTVKKDNNDSVDEQDDKVMLDRVVTTGSHIRATNLEEASPVFSMDRDESTINPDPKVAGKLSKTKENTTLDNRNVGISKNKGVNLNSDGVGQVLIYPYYVVKNHTQTDKDGVSKYVGQPLESIKPISFAQLYITKMNSLEDLTYQNASGYWANTYLPGDSSMRLLEANLADDTTMTMNNSINQNIQPFDYPNNAALAVYLNSDVANIESQQPTRMRVQVGIQASNRQGGQRSAMNIALVFDMQNKSPEYAAKMKALLLALLKSKQPGDNISLTVAGVDGGLMIEPQDFRHGQIQVVMNTLFADVATDTETLNLTQALQQASMRLQTNDDPTATLGSSVLMLFTANNISKLSEIESMVHKNAVKGITLSTISLGKHNHQQLKQLALAGQGHARILQSGNNISEDAKRVIDAELLASSRAVARALRLRIRLAKGVKLIKVIDSYNLNEKQSQRVRDAEQSLDKRLSKNLGITADRGEDEEGIQIVIPSFFAGDTHVVLLDVVASQAGAVADVSIRYKDLLYLRNAVSRKQLNLQNSAKPLGPLLLNVMKNVLASRFANTIKQAGKHIRNGNNTQALTLLQEMQKLYQSMRAQFPAWNKDSEILQDEKLLQEYITILKSITINEVQKINYIIDSMQYISWRKQITLTR